MRHVISCLVENQSGVLSRITGLFSGRGFNIDSLCVGETTDPSVSRMTIVVRGDDRILEQVTKQLNKLVDVIKVQDYVGQATVERELILVKVKVEPTHRSELLQIVDIFQAKIVDVNPRNMTIEMSGDAGKIEAIVDLLKPYKIIDFVRTGRAAVNRG